MYSECVICLDPVILGEDSAVMDCLHCFHQTCIHAWLKYEATDGRCPVCNVGKQVICTAPSKVGKPAMIERSVETGQSTVVQDEQRTCACDCCIVS